jgi:LysM repeat protein
VTVTLYPGADRTSSWFAGRYAGDLMHPNSGVIHTTEGTDWDSYSGGASAPHITAKPDFAARRLRFRQHFPFDHSARALVNAPGGVETNTLNVIQIELIGTCDPKTHAAWTRAHIDHIYWPEAPDWALHGLAEFLAWHYTNNRIPLRGPEMWLAYGADSRRPGVIPASYGASPARMTYAQWNGFTGWCGHMHVPENYHGDPGALLFAKVIAMAKDVAGVTKPPAPTPPKKKTVIVWAGTTLSAIAVLAGVTLASLISSTKSTIPDPNHIRPGQTVILPPNAKPVTPPKASTTPKPPAPTPKPKPAVDLSRLINAARQDPKGAQGHQTYPAGVKVVEAALRAEGLLAAGYANDGSFGSTAVAAYAELQNKYGYRGAAADGIPGRSTLVRFGAKHGFTVTP